MALISPLAVLVVLGIVACLAYLQLESPRARRRRQLKEMGHKVADFVPGRLPIVGHAIELDKDQIGFFKKSLQFSKGKPFYWQVGPGMELLMVPEPEFAKTFFKADEDTLGFNDAVKELLVLDITMSHELQDLQHHIKAIKANFTPNLHKYIANVAKHAHQTIAKRLGTEKEQPVVIQDLYGFIMDVVAACSSSSILGPAVVDDKEVQDTFKWFHLAIDDVLRWSKFAPHWVTSLYSKYRLGPHYQVLRRVTRKIVEERRAVLAQRESSESNDGDEYFIDYLIAYQDKDKYSEDLFAQYIGAMIFASMSTTSNSLRLCLQEFAYRKDVQEELRQEQGDIVSEHGEKLTRPIVDGMRHLESAIKEALRHGATAFGFLRMTQTDMEIYGTYVPKGELVSFPPYPVHFDEGRYKDAHEYDQTRFLKSTQHATADFLVWGSGKHACPGRFFAVQEMKIIIATLLRNYKFETIDGQKAKVFLSLVSGAFTEPKPVVFTAI